MIDDFDLARTRIFHALRPDAISAANRDRQDRHAGFHRDPRRARFKGQKLAVGKGALAFRKNDQRIALAQKFERLFQGVMLAAFAGRINGKRAEPAN